MIKIYSKLNGKLLHQVDYLQPLTEQRQDLCPDEQFLQCALLNMKKGTKFRPHQHIWKQKNQSIIAQESWCVIRGSVKVYFYDIDSTLLETLVIKAGDATFTFEGGHTYEILEDETIVREYKTGPYEGIDNDKIFLEVDK